MRILCQIIGLVALISVICASAFAIPQPKFAHSAGETSTPPPDLKDVGIVEKLGSTIDIQNLHFRDETGKDVQLSTFFNSKKPVIFSLVYYGCPNLCTLVLNGLTEGLRSMTWNVGDQFEVVTLSIDPKEDADLAASKKKAHLEIYRRYGAEAGWHFLTGSDDQIKKVAAQLGFGYHYDEKAKEFAHAAGIFVLSPTGMISRVLYGVEFAGRDLKLALLEASEGRIGTIGDRLLLYCYKYDALARGYSFYAMRMVQAGAALTIVLMFGYFFFFWRREKRFAQAQAKYMKEGMRKP